MNVILLSMKQQKTLRYFNDDFFLSKTSALYTNYASIISTLLKDSNITRKLEMCVSYQFHRLSGRFYLAKTLEKTFRTLDAIRVVKPLRNLTALKAFLEPCNLFRLFVFSFVRVAVLFKKIAWR